MFSTYLHLQGPRERIAYGGDASGEVIGVGDIPISSKYSITNVLYVDPLGYNLLSVSQLSEIGFDCHFSDKGVHHKKGGFLYCPYGSLEGEALPS